jgi:pimeloyl-ACP methyl ester carboxylesterase
VGWRAADERAGPGGCEERIVMSSLLALRLIRLRLLVMLLLSGGLLATGLFSPSAHAASASRAVAPKPTIVLVHGAWADSSSWSGVISRLQRDGYTVLAEPNPLRGLATDAAYLSAFIQQRTTGPVVLVGHSYGGAVITDAATGDPTVKALVYVDAFAPDQGESVLGLQSTVPGAPDPNSLFDTVAYPGAPAGDADLYLKTPVVLQDFAAGLPAARAEEIAATQRPVTLSALAAPSSAPAWKTIPSWYVLGTQDKIIAPSLQLMMAERAHSHITRVATGHLSLITAPGVVTSVILAAAHAVG